MEGEVPKVQSLVRSECIPCLGSDDWEWTDDDWNRWQSSRKPRSRLFHLHVCFECAAWPEAMGAQR